MTTPLAWSRGHKLLTSFNNHAIRTTASLGGLTEPEWRQLVERLSELNEADFETAVLAVRLRRRFEEENRAGGCDGAPAC